MSDWPGSAAALPACRSAAALRALAAHGFPSVNGERVRQAEGMSDSNEWPGLSGKQGGTASIAHMMNMLLPSYTYLVPGSLRPMAGFFVYPKFFAN